LSSKKEWDTVFPRLDFIFEWTS